MNTEFKVLVVEDNPDDFVMLQRSLRRTRLFELTWERSASEGLSALADKNYDVLLLDLTLPDSRGLESVVAFTDLASTPVVVLSGMDDEITALESVQHGAHDYLVKGKFDTALISRTLRYTIERFRLQEALRESQQQVRQERELRRLESDISVQSPHPMPAEGDANHLQARNPECFFRAVTQYDHLIDKALELRDFKIEYNLAANLRLLADSLGAYRASPRDVIDIHTTALNAKLAEMSARRSSLCNEEARYLLMGLLGHLCLHYQSQCAPSTSVSAAERV